MVKKFLRFYFVYILIVYIRKHSFPRFFYHIFSDFLDTLFTRIIILSVSGLFEDPEKEQFYVRHFKQQKHLKNNLLKIFMYF